MAGWGKWEVGSQLDVLCDTKWMSAKVIDVKNNKLQVKYANLPDPEWVDGNDRERCTKAWDKVPQRSVYGGRREQVDRLMLRLNAIRQLGDVILSEQDQAFLVGDNFACLDNMVGYNTQNSEEKKIIADYVQLNIDFSIFALQVPERFHIHLLQFLTKIFDRKLVYFFYNSREESNEADGKFAIQQKQSKGMYSSTFLIHFLNYFGDNDGFEAVAMVLRLLAAGGEPSKHLCRGTSSVLIVTVLVYFLGCLTEHGAEDFRQDYVEHLNLSDLLEQIVQHISDDELRALDKDAFNNLGQHLEHLLACAYNDDEIAEFIEKISLDIALRFISSPLLTKSLEGLNELQNQIDAVNRTKNYGGSPHHGPTPAYTNSWDPPAPRNTHMTAVSLVTWIQERQVIKIVLDHSHEQVIKRATGVLKFLAQNNALTMECIDSLWKTVAESQDEVLVRIVYDLLAELSDEMVMEQLDSLYEKVRARPFQNFRVWDLHFVQHFTMNAVKKTKGSGRLYGLDLFWQIMQDTALSTELTEQASKMLEDLLSANQFKEQRLVYVMKCLENVKQGRNSLASLILVQNIFRLRAELVLQANEKYPLVDMILTDLHRHMGLARAAAVGLGSADEKVIMVGQHTHATHITTRMEILNFILSSLKILMQQVQFGSLRDALLTCAVVNADIRQLMSWLTEADSTERRSRHSTFDDETKFFIFNSFLCCPPSDDVLSEWWHCFEQYFIAVNVLRDCLTGGNPRVTNYDDLDGMDALWKFAVCAHGEEVANNAAGVLVQIPIRLDFVYQDQEKCEIYRRFVVTCMDLLARNIILAKKSDGFAFVRIKRVVLILRQFLTKLVDEYVKPPLYTIDERVLATWHKHSHTEKRNNLYPAQVTAHNSDGTYQLYYDANDKDLRCYEHCIRDATTKQSRHQVIPSESVAMYPRTFLASEQAYFELFFELLGLRADIGKQVWDLLIFLPTNRVMADTIVNLDESVKVDWTSILPASPAQLLYTLQIVQNSIMADVSRSPRASFDVPEPGDPPVLARSRSSKTRKWCSACIHTGGLDRICHILRSFDPEEIRTSLLMNSCVELLVRLVLLFMNEAEERLEIDFANLASCSFDIINVLCKSTMALEHEATEKTCRCLLELLDTISRNSNVDMFKFNWGSVLLHGLFACPNELLRQRLCEDIPKLPAPTYFFLDLCLQIVDTQGLGNASTEFYMFLEELFQAVTLPYVIGADNKKELHPAVASVGAKLCHQIKTQSIIYESDTERDNKICALLNLVRTLVAEYHQLSGRLGEMDLVQELFNKLFAFVPYSSPCEGASPPPKFKHPDTRQNALALLAELSKHCAPNAEQLIAVLTPLHLEIHSAGVKRNKWDFSVKDKQVRLGYAGLQNLGCICYMNSAIQQLFMVPRLRENVLAITHPKVSESSGTADAGGESNPDGEKKKPKERILVPQFQFLLASLQDSHKSYVNPSMFTNVWNDDEGQPVNVGVQDDSSAFVTKLVDRVNEEVKEQEEHKNALRDVIGGLLSNELMGRDECGHFRAKDEEFFTVIVEIMNKKTLEECLQHYVKGEIMEGVKCEKCNQKRTVLKRATLKKLPNTLCITLKRFELDFYTMETKKIEDRLEFPMDLNMKPYTSEFLRPPESAQEKMKEDHPDAEGSKFQAVQPDSYYQYRLKGVSIHAGTMNSGHYYSLIQDRVPGDITAGEWFKFNDHVVSEYNIENLSHESFGGGTGPKSWGGRPSAYMLWYDRVEQVGTSTPPTRNPALFEAIRKENEAFFRDRLTYNMQYFDFMYDVVVGQVGDSGEKKDEKDEKDEKDDGDAANKKKDKKKITKKKQARKKKFRSNLATVIEGQTVNPLDRVTRLATRFLFYTLSRARHKESLPKWIELLKKLYSDNVASSAWLLHVFAKTDSFLIADLLLACPHKDVRVAAADFVCMSIEIIHPLEQPSEGTQDKEDATQIVLTLIEAALSQFSMVTKGSDSFRAVRGDVPSSAYFRVLGKFAKLGMPEILLFHKHKTLKHTIEAYLAKTKAEDKLKRDCFPEGGDLSEMFYFLSTLLEAYSLDFIIEKPQEGAPPPDPAKLILGDMTNDIFKKELFVKLIAEPTTVARAVPVCNILKLFCADQTVTMKVLDFTFYEIKQEVLRKVRPYVRVLQSFLEIRDDRQAWRTENVLKNLMDVLEEQTCYWKETDFFIDHLIRFAKRFELVRQLLHTSWGDKLRRLMKWVDNNRDPPPVEDYYSQDKYSQDKYSQDKMKLTKTVRTGGYSYGQQSWNGYGRTIAYGLTAQHKFHALKRIADGDLNNLGTDHCSDSDDDEDDREINVSSTSTGGQLPTQSFQGSHVIA